MPRRFLLGLFVCLACAWTMRWSAPSVEAVKSAGAEKAQASEPGITAPFGKWSPSATVSNPLSGGEAEALRKALKVAPNGVFREQLLALPERDQLVALQSVAKLGVPKEDFDSLRVSAGGDLYYVCDVAPPADGLKGREPGKAAVTPKPGQAGVAFVDTIFTRHSRPGSSKVLYLDFKGGTISGTQWNTQYSTSKYTAKPYDNDGDPSSFVNEAYTIDLIWQQVSEDFAPFDIDVTTERPASFNSQTGHVMFTFNKDANGINMPSSDSGGVAFLDKFGLADYATKYSPAFVYVDRTLYNPGWLGSTASHEFGHNLGLSHDGVKGGDEYYQGHSIGYALWSPIMGAGGTAILDQWSKGEYYLSNNQQDDLKIIGDHLTYIPDPGHHVVGTAADAVLSPGVVKGSGILRKADEAVVYKIDVGAGPLRLDVDSRNGAGELYQSPDLDARIELMDASGAVLASAAPEGTLTSWIDYEAKDGVYYIKLSPAGEGSPLSNPPTGYTAYGSVGHYLLTGSFVGFKPEITNGLQVSRVTSEDINLRIEATNYPTAYSADPLPAGLSLNAKTGILSGSIRIPGTYVLHLSASNRWGIDRKDLTLSVAYSLPRFPSQPAGKRTVLSQGGSATFACTVESDDSELSVQWRHNGRPIEGATSSTLNLQGATPEHEGWYDLAATNSAGTSFSDPLFVLYAIPKPEIVSWTRGTGPAEEVRQGNTLFVSADKDDGFALTSDPIAVGWGTATPRAYPDDEVSAVGVLATGWYSAILKADGSIVSWYHRGLANYKPGKLVLLRSVCGELCAVRQDGGVSYIDINWPKIPFFEALQNVADISGKDGRIDVLFRDGVCRSIGTLNKGEERPADVPGIRKIATSKTKSYLVRNDGVLVTSGPNVSVALATDVIDVSAASSTVVALKRDGTVIVLEDPEFAIAASIKASFRGVAKLGGACVLRDRSGDTVPVISQNPVDVTAGIAGTARFSAIASSGTSYLNYQWRKDGVAIDGATDAELVLGDLGQGDAGLYDVVVTSAEGSTTSLGGRLSLVTAPVINSQSPQLITYLPGDPLDLFVTASGSGTLKFQWSHNGIPIPGAASSIFHLSTTDLASAGAYSVEVRDDQGSRTAQMFVRRASKVTQVRFATPQFFGYGVDEMDVRRQWGHSNVHFTDGYVIDTAGGVRRMNQGVLEPFRISNFPVSDEAFDVVLNADGSVDTSASTGKQRLLERRLKNVISITASGRLTTALKADGSVIFFDSRWGVVFPTPNFDQRVTAIAGASTYDNNGYNRNYALALLADGTVRGWSDTYHELAAVPAGLDRVKRIFAFDAFACAIREDGEAVLWGNTKTVKVPLTHALKISKSMVLYENGTVAPLSGDYSNFNRSNSTVFDISEYAYIRDASGDKAPSATTISSTVTMNEGSDGELSAQVETGTNDYVVEWYKGASKSYNDLGAVLRLSFVTPYDEGDYTLRVRNDMGSADVLFSVMVQRGPAIRRTSVVNQIAQKGSPAELFVEAEGAGDITYQWSKDGEILADQTASTLRIPEMKMSDAGRYAVFVSDTRGKVMRLFNLTFAPKASQLVILDGYRGTNRDLSTLGVVVGVGSNESEIFAWRADGMLEAWGASWTKDFSELKGVGWFSQGEPISQTGTPFYWREFGGAIPTSPYVAISGEYGLRSDGTVATGQAAYSKPWRTPSKILDLSASGLWIGHDGAVTAIYDYSNARNNRESPARGFDTSGDLDYTLRKNGEWVVRHSYIESYRQVLGTKVVRAVIRQNDRTNWKGVQFDRDGRFSGPTSTEGLSRVYSISPYAIVRDSEGDTSPLILEQPKSTVAAVGSIVLLSVKVSDRSTNLSFQWRKDGTAIAGATSSTFRITDLTEELAGMYDVVISSPLGSVTSGKAKLDAAPVPSFTTTSPGIHVVKAGSPLVLAGNATGTGAISYQWYLDGIPVPGATSVEYRQERMRLVDAGTYRVQATDSNGSNSRLFRVVYEPHEVSVLQDVNFTSGKGLSVPAIFKNARLVSARDNEIFGALNNGKLAVVSEGLMSLLDYDAVKVNCYSSEVEVLLRNGTAVQRDIRNRWSNLGVSDSVDLSDRTGYGVFTLNSKGDLSIVDTNVGPWPHVAAFDVSSTDCLFVRFNGTAGAIDYVTMKLVEFVGLEKVAHIHGSRDQGYAVLQDGTIVNWGLRETVSFNNKIRQLINIAGAQYTQKLDGSLQLYTPVADREISFDPAKAVSSYANGTRYGIILDRSADIAPNIVSQPEPSISTAGSQVTLGGNISGADLTYQWYKDGAAIDGATSATLVLSSIQTSDAGRYALTASNAYGSVTSRAAAVTVGDVTPSRIKNMSVRASSGTGGSPLIVGFVMSGGAKNVLVRAIGPTLSAFGVSGVMPDPQLILHSSASGSDVIVNTNDNWTDGDLAATMSATFASVGAFALSDTTSKDASLFAPVVGSRTVHVSPITGTQPGVVLVEAYDAGTGVSPHLINVSARNLAGSGSDTLIAGFVIDGTQPKKVLIRGIGPTLTAFGVTGVLADPLLEVHTTLKDSNNQPVDTIVATNDNWLDEPGAAAAFTAAGAFSLQAVAKDSAIVVTLPFGAYTAVVRGADGGTGEALVEVYEVP